MTIEELTIAKTSAICSSFNLPMMEIVFEDIPSTMEERLFSFTEEAQRKES